MLFNEINNKPKGEKGNVIEHQQYSATICPLIFGLWTGRVSSRGKVNTLTFRYIE